MLHTTIAGSLPKPSWLAEPEKLWAAWRVPPESLAQAQRDAVLVALREQETAGIDVVTDGEQSRQHFVHGFLERLEGIDFGKRVTIGIRADRHRPHRAQGARSPRRGAVGAREHPAAAEVHDAGADEHRGHARRRALS